MLTLRHYPRLQEELLEVVDFFLKPQRFRRSGAKIPRGILLCGPPGAPTCLGFWCCCLKGAI